MNFPIRPTSFIFKVILVTSFILILAISLSVWLNIRLHEASIKNMTYEKKKIISEFIEKNVIRTMEKGRHFEIHAILRNFTYSGIYKINVFRPDGLITASTVEKELGERVKDVEFFLNDPYFIREETILEETGKVRKERVSYLNRPILNHPECFQCHNPQQKIVAVLTVANTLRKVEEEISRVKRNTLLIAILTVGFLSLSLGILFARFVNRPIQILSKTMRRVEEGDLGARVAVHGSDEMGRLAQNLNSMIEKLQMTKKEAERYHQELIQRADRMATLGELASGIAHEIRNPLAGIQGAMLILSEGFPKGDQRREVTEEIQKQIYRLERLVKDLLNYAKPAAVSYFPTEINPLVEKMVSFFLTHKGEQNHCSIVRNYSDALPRIMADPNALEQAFLNIVLNAQKAMPKGGTLTITTRAKTAEEGEKVEITFEDTGMGISKENLRKIFNPFFSTRPEGTGLGLAITKNIIEQHGGTIEVESEVNRGTKVLISLPTMESA